MRPREQLTRGGVLRISEDEIVQDARGPAVIAFIEGALAFGKHALFAAHGANEAHALFHRW